MFVCYFRDNSSLHSPKRTIILHSWGSPQTHDLSALVSQVLARKSQHGNIWRNGADLKQRCSVKSSAVNLDNNRLFLGSNNNVTEKLETKPPRCREQQGKGMETYKKGLQSHVKWPMQVTFWIPSPCPLDQQVVPPRSIIRTPFRLLGIIPGTAVSKDTVWSPESKSQWAVWTSQAEVRTLAVRSGPLCVFLVSKRRLSRLGVRMRWTAIGGERILTTEAKTVFQHPNADERPKGIVSQSAVWEGK